MITAMEAAFFDLGSDLGVALGVGLAVGLGVGLGVGAIGGRWLGWRSRPQHPVSSAAASAVDPPAAGDPPLPRAAPELQTYVGQWHEFQHAFQQQEFATLQAQLVNLASQQAQVATTLETLLGTLGVDPVAAATLQSDLGLDYRPLNDWLGTGAWRAANTETRSLLEQATGGQWHNLAHLPLTDLATLDYLWRYWSGDRFGLTIQYDLWQSLQGDYGAVCDRLGWRVKNQWCYDDELIFAPDAAIGHLPAATWQRRACYGPGAMLASETMNALMHRVALWLDAIPADHEP